MKFFLTLATMVLMTASTLTAAPLKILAIGDSLTEEYAYEITFSAPASNPTNANVRNWPELLRLFRPTEATLGTLKTTAGAYLDLRDAGQEWNFGIPGTTTRNWKILLTTDSPYPFPSGESLGFGYYLTRRSLLNELPVVEVVVIVLGANDLKQDYDEIYSGSLPANFFNDLTARLAFIVDWVRAARPTVPIVIATVPDVGATPDIASTYNGPTERAAARAKIAAFNQGVVAMAATKGVTVARLDRLTDRVFDEIPFQLNGTVFTLQGAPENPPDRVFCRDNFHASTVAQALIANEILQACSTATGRSTTPFSNREILTFLQLNPDSPYQNWASAYPGIGTPTGDTDGDGIPNLVEFAMGTSPVLGSSPFQFTTPDDTLQFATSASAMLYLDLQVSESGDLTNWSPVSNSRITIDENGIWSISPPLATQKNFYRVTAITKP